MKAEPEDTVWTPIPDLEGYFCNPNGQIASKKTNSYRLLVLEGKHKQTVRVTEKKSTCAYDVHFLIAYTFIPNPDGYEFVRHKNGESWDNRVENLEWSQEEVKYRSLRYSAEKMKATFPDFLDWKTIEEYPNYYFNPDGRIVSISGRISIMKPVMKFTPSLMLIDTEGRRHSIQPVNLILRLFVPNPEGCTKFEYIDGNDANYAASNLRWKK
jgi:hypothetical protein